MFDAALSNSGLRWDYGDSLPNPLIDAAAPRRATRNPPAAPDKAFLQAPVCGLSSLMDLHTPQSQLSERFRARQNPTKWTKWKDPPVHSFAFILGTAILGIVEKPRFDLVNYGAELRWRNYGDSLLNHRNSPAPLPIDAAK